MTSISLIIPTFKRPDYLKRCLEGVIGQNRKPDELLVVVRDTDAETRDFLRDWRPPELEGLLKIVSVHEPGQVASLNAGLAAATGDIVSITDDDACPHQDWLERIERHLEKNQELAGVGGRDFVKETFESPPRTGPYKKIGTVEKFGRCHGNHHLGEGPPVEVDFLKGVNLSFRRELIKEGFSTRLKGEGAQVHNDMELCMRLRSAGWKLLYDPSVAVDHYAAPRHDNDKRFQAGVVSLNPQAVCNEAHNLALVAMDHFPPMAKVGFWIRWILIGDNRALGLVKLILILPQEGWPAVVRTVAGFKGRLAGIKTHLDGKRAKR